MPKLFSGSELLLESLRRQQVEVFFGLPGGAVLPLYDALYSANIRHLLVRHEQAAAFAADGYARVTGKPGVCLGTSGPGATNLITGLTSAMMDSIPVVALTGQVPLALIGKDAFQEADTIGISLPSTKQSFLVRSAAEVPGVIQAAFKSAVSGRPGPVLVDLPKSVLMETAEANFPPAAGQVPAESPHEWTDDDLERAADMILESKRAVLYAGGGVITANASEELRELADLTHIPLTTTLMGLGCFPSRHPLSLGHVRDAWLLCHQLAICQCDLLIAVGARFDDRVTGRLNGFATNAKKIHLDVDPSEVNKNVRVDLALVGDAKETLRALLAALQRRNARPSTERQQWLQRIESWRSEHPLTYDKYANNVKPQFVIETLAQYASEDAIVAVDVGQHQMWGAHSGISRARDLALLERARLDGLRIPGGHGCADGIPNRQVIAIVGDGGFHRSKCWRQSGRPTGRPISANCLPICAPAGRPCCRRSPSTRLPSRNTGAGRISFKNIFFPAACCRRGRLSNGRPQQPG